MKSAYKADTEGMSEAKKRAYLHEEMAAESCFDALSNDAFFDDFRDKMSKTEEGQTFLQKLAQFFADLAKQLKKAVQGYAARTNNEMVRELMNDAEMLEHINTRFRELLEGAEKVTLPGTTDGNTIKFSRMNNKSFAENVNDILTMSDEEALQNKTDGNFVSILRHTPKVILDNVEGAEDHEIIISFHSLYLETRNSGVLEGNYHSLGKDIVAALPRYLSDPDAIVRMKSGRLNLFATVTEGKKKNRVISVKMNTVKDINSKNENYHLVITIFPAGNNYIKNDIAGNGDYIEYEKEGLAQVNPQLRASLATINAKPSGTIIPDSEGKINTSDENNGAGDVRGQRTLDNDAEGVESGLHVRIEEKGNFVEDKYFESQIRRWDEQTHGAYVKVGVLGAESPLAKVGMPEGILSYDVSKLNKNKEKHGDYLTDELLLVVPEVIAHPVVITEYREANTISVFGNYFIHGSPLMIGVIISKDRGGNTISRIRTVNIRSDVKRLITDNSVLYLGENKKRTLAWFQACGIQVPLGGSKFGFIRSIPYVAPKVKPQRSLDTAEEADARALMEENEALRAQVEMLQAEFKLTRDFMGTRAIKHHLRELTKEYGAKSSGKLFDKLYEQVQFAHAMLSASGGNEAEIRSAQDVIFRIAREIIASSDSYIDGKGAPDGLDMWVDGKGNYHAAVDAQMELTRRILDKLTDEKIVPVTYADKSAEKQYSALEKQRREYQRRINELRSEKNAKYARDIEALKEKYRARIIDYVQEHYNITYATDENSEYFPDGNREKIIIGVHKNS